MKHREFEVGGVKYCIVESNATEYKWQAMAFDVHYNAWVRTSHYANTQAELKEDIKDINGCFSATLG